MKKWSLVVALLALCTVAALPAGAGGNGGGKGSSGCKPAKACPPTDKTAPAATIVAPSDAAEVAGAITVKGTAADDAGVAAVEIAVDSGGFSSASGTAEWSASIDTTALADGDHTITARARDGAGNVGTDVVTITVANAAAEPTEPDPIEPTPTPTEPAPTEPSPTSPPPSEPTPTEPAPTSDPRLLVTPEGATIEIAPDVTNWTAQQVYELLKPNAFQLGLIGPSLRIKVQTTNPSSTGSSASTSGGVYTSFRATITLDARGSSSFNDRPDYVLTHEYGHAWTLYHLYLTQQKDWTRWLTFRGLEGDSRVDSTYSWTKSEMIADDYRLLFGTPTAQSQASYINRYAPDPRTIAGFREWFVSVWARA